MLGEYIKSGKEQPRAVLSESDLEALIDPSRLPRHIAVIMDGNGRWASRQAMPRVAGYRPGVQSLKRITRHCVELGIEILTVYAFSTENWKRPREEVSFLFRLMEEVLDTELEEMNQNGVQLRVIGRLDAIDPMLLEKCRRAEEVTRGNSRLILNVGINYGGRAEIVDAVKNLVARVACGELDPESIDEELLSRSMYTSGLPDPDLLIRTGGDSRISNFLLWQLAYTELWITPVCWPEFNRVHLLQAILDYQQRDRRYGGT